MPLPGNCPANKKQGRVERDDTRHRVLSEPARPSALAPFRIRNYRFQWPADLLTSWAFEMETLILGWYVLVETGSVLLLTLFASLRARPRTSESGGVGFCWRRDSLWSREAISFWRDRRIGHTPALRGPRSGARRARSAAFCGSRGDIGRARWDHCGDACHRYRAQHDRTRAGRIACGRDA